MIEGKKGLNKPSNILVAVIVAGNLSFFIFSLDLFFKVLNFNLDH